MDSPCNGTIGQQVEGKKAYALDSFDVWMIKENSVVKTKCSRSSVVQKVGALGGLLLELCYLQPFGPDSPYKIRQC